MGRSGVSLQWSILIATLAHREEKFLHLLSALMPQVEAAGSAEVVALRNHGEKAISQYRQALLDSAQGEYVSFVDDDDDVSPDFVSAITEALNDSPDVVGFAVECVGMGAPRTLLSVKYWGAPWDPVMYEGQETYLRYPTHLCPVRTTMARRAGFTGAVRYGEDFAYTTALHPVLVEAGEDEVCIPRFLYRYNWSAADSSRAEVPAILVHRRKAERRVLPQVFSPEFRFRWHPWSQP
jgi:hypothetical protein